MRSDITGSRNGGLYIVTGGSGYIGRAVALRLASDGRLGDQPKVVILDSKEPGIPMPGVEYIETDLGSAENVRGALERIEAAHGQTVTSVIHLAAYYSFSGKPSPLYGEITVGGTARLLRSLQSVFKTVEQFLFTSTMLVHAPSRPARKIDERSPLHPRWHYPQSKVEAERIIKQLHGRIPSVILRVAGVYDDHCHSLPIANQIRRIHGKELTSHFFPADASHGQAFVHLDDLVSVILLAVVKRGALPHESLFMIGEPEVMSYHDLQQQIGERLHGHAWATLWVPPPLARVGAAAQSFWAKRRGKPAPFIQPWMIPLAGDHYELDISHARKLLGWEPRHSLRSTLPGILNELANDPVAWYRDNKLAPPERMPPTRPAKAPMAEPRGKKAA